MKSILRQLAKYQPPVEESTPIKIEVKAYTHPYQEIVENLCDITDPQLRKETINNALLALNDFTPPLLVNQLYPIEIAILYYLFYRHKILLCGDSSADTIYGYFLKSVVERDGSLDLYMHAIKESLDNNALTIFLCRIMIAAFGARDKYENKRDRIDRNYGVKAAEILRIKTAKEAWKMLEEFNANASIEQAITGRIAYIAFWEWSKRNQTGECNHYLNENLPRLSFEEKIISH